VARVLWCERTEGFCSPGFDVEPSDRNEQSTMFGPSHGPKWVRNNPGPSSRRDLVCGRADTLVGPDFVRSTVK
jgi:hypothetical protein